MKDIGITCLYEKKILTRNGSGDYVDDISSISATTFDISLSRIKQTMCMTPTIDMMLELGPSTFLINL